MKITIFIVLYTLNAEYTLTLTFALSPHGRTPFYAVSVNGLHRVRVRDGVRVRACRPDSSGNLLTRRKVEFAHPHIIWFD